MFGILKENKKLKEQIKAKSLDNTILHKENEAYKYKLHQIITIIERFDYKKDNVFSLVNKIKKEASSK